MRHSAIKRILASTLAGLFFLSFLAFGPPQAVAKKPICQDAVGRNLYFTKPRMQGQDVLWLQTILISMGHFKGKANGIFDKNTKEAVMKLQKSQGIKPDGVVGPQTANILYAHEEMMHKKDKQPLPPGKLDLWVDVDKSLLQVKIDGRTVKKFPVCVGKYETPTPIGEWKVAAKEMSMGIVGVRFMLLNVPWGNYGIHGTDRPWSIGGSLSAGCVRMFNDDVRQLFEWVPVGTPVHITGWLYSDFYEERPVLRLGMVGSEVFRVQEQLVKMDYMKSKPDGKFEEGTREALKRFQKDHGFEPDGEVTVNLWGALGL